MQIAIFTSLPSLNWRHKEALGTIVNNIRMYFHTICSLIAILSTQKIGCIIYCFQFETRVVIIISHQSLLNFFIYYFTFRVLINA